MMDRVLILKKMKKNLTFYFVLTMMLAFTSIGTNAQITLEQNYYVPEGKAFYYTNLGNNNYKYFLIDLYNDKFSLYNLDHTPYILNIPTAVSLDSGEYSVAYITSSLFDCDSTNIEYVLTTWGGWKPFYVFRTDGTQLFKKDSVTGPYLFGGMYDGSIIVQPIFNTPFGAKLILMNLHTDIWSVYSLCGTLPETTQEIEHGNQYVQIYPNPSSETTTFKIDAPSNFEKYEFTIYDASVQKLKTEYLTGSKTVTIDNTDLSSGTYFFSLQTKNKIVQTGKFIVTK
jgi:hypothetical protein